MDMLDSNYRTFCAQNDIPLDDGPLPNGESGDVAMDAEGADDNTAVEMDDLDEMEVDDMDDAPDFFKAELEKKQTKTPRKKKGKVAELVRDKIRKVLEDTTGLADKRARMCDEADFLKLLSAFNSEGIHFN